MDVMVLNVGIDLFQSTTSGSRPQKYYKAKGTLLQVFRFSLATFEKRRRDFLSTRNIIRKNTIAKTIKKKRGQKEKCFGFVGFGLKIK